MIAFLNGSKTYLTAAGAGIVLFAQQVGWLTEEQGRTILEALGVLLVVFLRMGVATTTAVAATSLGVATGTTTAIEARAVSVANPAPTPKEG